MSTLSSVLAACVIQAASVHQLPPELLVAVIKVEGGAPGIAAKNRNRTEDLGVMQINTGAWLDLVARAHFNGDRDQAYLRLRDDACYNVQVGAWILQRSIKQSEGDLWHGIGRYHSATPVHNQRYQARVQKAWGSLF
ncbi:lytic transglycosylase domain-containing protein [Yersinia mollaretii]|uniref:Conjugal transfer protein TrbN n=1 Tax=Yersinia mollaretii TaxID=33060 RepID=A0AA36PGE0_YERMO|nr:lytic transglycosylase domain-containing protein [Yersinia mollaretii]MDA5535453.1 lytic transglycosylase domain-containing protein [Yersinia mollaretii]MDN0111356.1 lytic transglycosylase domain-containing protein [Yersinia mollaretii]NIL03667.1 lytic transglycosylase domain-containing protein [Yersinia mollaretii]PJE88268.1 lytic transglycosylase [Yersinia mollaretii]QKJ02009.1 lytic transglycosylase domain-containing protein [Yersinia mollaretii ATCC 43969]